MMQLNIEVNRQVSRWKISKHLFIAVVIIRPNRCQNESNQIIHSRRLIKLHLSGSEAMKFARTRNVALIKKNDAAGTHWIYDSSLGMPLLPQLRRNVFARKTDINSIYKS